MLDRNKIKEKMKEVDAQSIPLVFLAALERYQELFPDWDIVSFSLEKCKDRNMQIDRMIDFMKQYKQF